MKFMQMTRFYQLLQNLQKLQISLLPLSLITLIFCNQISGYLCDYNENYWYYYFVITERFSMLLLLVSASKYLKEKCWLGYELLLALLAQDFIDRAILDIQVFNFNDIICIGIITIQLIIKIYVKFKKHIQNRVNFRKLANYFFHTKRL